jgi:hypothetical protein
VIVVVLKLVPHKLLVVSIMATTFRGGCFLPCHSPEVSKILEGHVWSTGGRRAYLSRRLAASLRRETVVPLHVGGKIYSLFRIHAAISVSANSRISLANVQEVIGARSLLCPVVTRFRCPPLVSVPIFE